ncbi:small, acid-soluble spore protein, alpha/beta type [Bacillus shivajii]|uniref:small, acid-soluble spore protein, alpha/beta type n=1 Tax=Bacillus shivajii TaxID=1983719 RepID=UPI001CF9D623|nr:small, acid-soluble spore protein, alpha/beta type [Bacillus shivajii]UCZ51738.1 small, acid-soluble spore protein, alpha/beta type [Bacillus shivajii]
MDKRSKLVVDGVEDYMNQYRAEVAQEFGIFHSATQNDQQGKIGSATRKILQQKEEK